jgi:hypothetical protein
LGTGTPQEPPTQQVTMGFLTGSTIKYANGWRAQGLATVLVYNGNGAPAAGVTVTGTYSPGSTTSCITNTAGQCSLSSGVFGKSVTATKLTITKLSGTSIVEVKEGPREISFTRP